MFAFYHQALCDPLEIGVSGFTLIQKTKTFEVLTKPLQLVDSKDQLFPLFVLQVFGDVPCVPGLFVAGVFSGALSTVSSGLNALASVTVQVCTKGAAKVIPTFKIAFRNQVLKLDQGLKNCITFGSRG